MPVGRIARVIAVGLPHHITQRGMGGEPFSMQRTTVRFTCNCHAPERWRDILATGVGEDAELERIHEPTRTGRPLGSPDFVRDVGWE
jgi:hypothetical protein